MWAQWWWLCNWGDTAVAEGAARAVFADVVARYGADGRFYHTLGHIQHLLTVLGEWPTPAQEPQTLYWAAWLHDVVYDPQADDNEAQSAAYARRVLPGLGLGETAVAQVAALIMLTKTHQVADQAGDGARLVDADLAILGAETAVYAAYAQAIRREYQFVPPTQYRLGRAAVLQRFLERPRIYHTDWLNGRLETAARRNLTAEYARLTAG